MIGKALAQDMEPHWTTVADFISSNSEMFKETFVKVLLYCAELGLIEGRTFAIDGCRIPSNASLELTGTAQELEKKEGKRGKETRSNVTDNESALIYNSDN